VSRRLAAVLLGAAVLSGCGTGLQAQVYKETGRGDSASADLDSLAIRNLHFEPAAEGNALATGDRAVMTGSFANRGDAQDTLTSISSPAAASVMLLQHGKAVSSIDIPAGGAAGGWTAVLEGVNRPVRAGQYLPVTLTFSRGGRTTLQVPLHISEGDLEGREVNQEPYGHGE